MQIAANSSMFTRVDTKKRQQRRAGCVEPRELLSTARQYGGGAVLVALAEHAARFRNIYFPLTASDSLPGRACHGEQVDFASVFVHARYSCPLSHILARVFRSELARGEVCACIGVCVCVCVCHEQCSFFFSIFKKGIINIYREYRKYVSRPRTRRRKMFYGSAKK